VNLPILKDWFANVSSPREVIKALHHLSRHQKGIGLSETELRERLNRLQELHILPEHRVQPDPNPDTSTETP
jgi:hypothetical protein